MKDNKKEQTERWEKCLKRMASQELREVGIL